MIKFIIGAFFGAIIQNLVAKWLRERARLVYYVQSISDHTLQDTLIPVRPPSQNEPNPPQVPMRVFTHSITIRNNGDRAANNVEVIHSYLPRHITVNPIDIVFTVDRAHQIIRFNALVPQQQITIGYLDFVAYSFQDIFNTVVRSNEGFAHPLAMTQYPAMPRWFNKTVWVLLLSGVLFIAFIIYKLSPYLTYAFTWLIDKVR